MAMLLNFEEKWENNFQCVVQAWSELVEGSSHVAFAFDIAFVHMKQVRSSMN